MKGKRNMRKRSKKKKPEVGTAEKYSRNMRRKFEEEGKELV